MKINLRESWNKFIKWLNTGRVPYIVSSALLVLGASLVYLSPRGTIPFLVFVLATAMVYFLNIKKTVKLALAVFIALILVPILGARNIFYLEVVFQITLFSALALGLNIVVGFSGILNLGYVAFYAVGAYLWGFFGSQQAFLLREIPGTAPIGTAFLLTPGWFYVFILLGVIVVAFVGLLLGLPVLRVRGDYLAIVTLGFGEVVRQLANNLDKPLNLTNGPQGITPIQKPPLSPAVVDLFNSVFGPLIGKTVTKAEFYNILFYFIALLVVIVAIIVTHRLNDSKIGRAWTAIREDELAATAMGIPANKMKLAAFAVGASFAGAMGVIFAANRTFVSPDSFNFMQSIGVLTMVILGGIGSIRGVVLGAAVVTILNIQLLPNFSLLLSRLRQSDEVIPLINFAWKNLSPQLDPTKYQKLLFGIILVLMMIYRPAGLFPAERRKRELKSVLANEDVIDPAVADVPASKEKNNG